MLDLKIGDLINFEKIKDVIDISTDLETKDSSKYLVEKYVISEDMKDNLIDMSKDLSMPKHNSVQIIGNYGSGKSHLLAFITAILSDNSLIDFVSDEGLKGIFKENLKRKFAVVQFELASSNATMAEFFYNNIEEQLLDKYGIDIEIGDLEIDKIMNHKTVIQKIINKIKDKEPEMGLVVIVDEISDFIKTKDKKEHKNREAQFIRIIGEASKAMDFMFIGAMQENIFSSTEFIDDAESIGRVWERFKVVTISNENIKKVISKRVLDKKIDQKEEIEEKLEEYARQIPLIRNKMEDFVNLYPLHPYAMDVFSGLPYFEKRGIIKFTVEQVEKIIDKGFDNFITFDKIYDEMESKHTIKNQNDVFPVVEAVRTLSSKLDLIDKDKQEDALKIVKALAILKILSKTTHNGATPEELANELLIISQSVKNIDRIKIIVEKIRKITDGQFINKTENGYYYLDLKNDVDYDVVIENRASNLRTGIKDEELLKIILHEFGFDDEDSESYRCFDDYCNWNERKSFRKGSFIYDDGTEAVKKGKGDFNFVIVSPYASSSKFSSSKDLVILKITFTEEIDELLKKISATGLLEKQDKYQKTIMKNKRADYIRKIKKSLLKSLINANIKNGEIEKNSKSILNQEPDTLMQFYSEIKPILFEEWFVEKYRNYPKFTHQLSNINIKGQMDSLIKVIVKNGINSFLTNVDKGYLRSLNIIDLDDKVNTENSDCTKTIIRILNDNKGKNYNIDDLLRIFIGEGYGLQEEIVYLFLVILTYTGEINMKQRGGAEITATELEDIFAKQGTKSFENIPYVTLEDNLPIGKIKKPFEALNLNSGLLNNKKTQSDAIQSFKDKAITLKSNKEYIQSKIELIRSNSIMFQDISIIAEYQSLIYSIPYDELIGVNTIAQFKNILFKDEKEYTDLKDKIVILENMYSFVKDYEEYLKRDYKYMSESIWFINSNDNFFPEKDAGDLIQLQNEINKVIRNFKKIIDFQERRIIKGKLQQYKEKYRRLYYKVHTFNVGTSVKWSSIQGIVSGSEYAKLRDLKNLKCISNAKFSEVQRKLSLIQDIKCERLIEVELEDNYCCPHCSFPNNININIDISSINSTIDDLGNEVIELLSEWEKTIIREVENYKDNLEYLNQKEKVLIEKFRNDGKLPEKIDSYLLSSLSNLFNNIEEVELSGRKLEEILFSEGEILDYSQFLERLERIKKIVSYDKDTDNIRIKKAKEDKK